VLAEAALRKVLLFKLGFDFILPELFVLLVYIVIVFILLLSVAKFRNKQRI